MLPERQTLSYEDGQVKLRKGMIRPGAWIDLMIQRETNSAEKQKEQLTNDHAAPEISRCCRLTAGRAMESESAPSAMDAVSHPCSRPGRYRTRPYKRRDWRSLGCGRPGTGPHTASDIHRVHS